MKCPKTSSSRPTAVPGVTSGTVSTSRTDAVRTVNAKHPKRHVPTEHQEQSWLFQWAELAERKYPELADLYAIPNFSGRLGMATIRHSVQLNREGRKKGIPDVHLPHARGGYHGLYLELKRVSGGRVEPAQKDWHDRLRAAGHHVVVCRGWEAAKDALTQYLALPTPLTAPEAQD